MTQATMSTASVITDAPINAILATSDLERALRWYADKLGLTSEPDIAAVMRLPDGDSMLELYETSFAGTAQNTVAVKNVPDLASEMARLGARGVTFEEYDFGDWKTVDGVMTDPEGGQNGWFKDADGSILSLGQYPDDVRPSQWSAMLAASDIARAKAWYAEVLGFTPVREFQGEICNYESGPTRFTVYNTSFAGTAKNTVAGWRVSDARSEVARLRSRGVTFEHYDLGDLGRTVDGILEDDEKVLAWFTDSEGNILSLAQDKRQGA